VESFATRFGRGGTGVDRIDRFEAVIEVGTHHIRHCPARQRHRIRSFVAAGRRGSVARHRGHIGRSHLGYHRDSDTSNVRKHKNSGTRGKLTLMMAMGVEVGMGMEREGR
jgi:hypothetical protein